MRPRHRHSLLLDSTDIADHSIGGHGPGGSDGARVKQLAVRERVDDPERHRQSRRGSADVRGRDADGEGVVPLAIGLEGDAEYRFGRSDHAGASRGNRGGMAIRNQREGDPVRRAIRDLTAVADPSRPDREIHRGSRRIGMDGRDQVTRGRDRVAIDPNDDVGYCEMVSRWSPRPDCRHQGTGIGRGDPISEASQCSGPCRILRLRHVEIALRVEILRALPCWN